MIKKLLILITLFTAALTLFMLYSSETEYEKLVPEFVQQAVAPDYESVPLETQVGQLFAIGHWNTTAVATTTARVRDLQLGSIIIMSTPQNDSTITTWTNSWQEASSIPLLISIDQEGGVVSRLKGSNHIQTPQWQITDVDTAYNTAKTRSESLLSLGINSNYSPVLDRSTSSDSFMYPRVFRNPTMISRLGDAMVRGYQNNGVIAAPKHFPGHPDTSDDSHLTLPILDIGKEKYVRHTQQFTDLISSQNVEMLMTAHVLIPQIDPDFPATVSPTIIADLRNRVGYDGVIITDDMAMQAISDRWSHEEAAILALQAGVDMIMLAAEPENIDTTIQSVLAAIESGELNRERVFEAYSRVMIAKEKLQ